MKVKVKYHGKEPTLVRPYVNVPKVPVNSGDTIEVDATVAEVLRRLPTWSVVGEVRKMDVEEEEALQRHRAEVVESERLKAERLEKENAPAPSTEEAKEGE